MLQSVQIDLRQMSIWNRVLVAMCVLLGLSFTLDKMRVDNWTHVL